MRVAVAASVGLLAWGSRPLRLDEDRLLSTAEVCERMLPSVFRIVLLDPATGTHQGVGSGFCIRPDGTALTAYHVIDSSSALIAKFDNGQKSPVQFVNGDKDTDVAIVKVAPCRPAKLGVSAKVRRGEQVIHFGNTMASNTIDIDVGYVNKTKDDVPAWMRSQIRGDQPADTSGLAFILTQGSARPGFSGGPLANMRAEVIGLISRMYMHFDGALMHHEGASIPIDFVLHIVEALETQGRLKRPSVGISAKATEDGLLLKRVKPGSAAERAGLKPGDIVLEINGVKIDSNNDFYHAVGFKEHVELRLKVRRGRQPLDLTLRT